MFWFMSVKVYKYKFCVRLCKIVANLPIKIFIYNYYILKCVIRVQYDGVVCVFVWLIALYGYEFVYNCFFITFVKLSLGRILN